MTSAQQQAVDSAQSYLSEGQGFSEQGLLNQLTSSSGECFLEPDAEFAIRYLNPDWDQQAVDAAEDYLSEGQGFSEQGLLNQLTSSYGSGFAAPDAEFAIHYLNPNWDQQAVDSAQSYLTGGQGFSEQGLIQQLTSSSGSGFTLTQAEYAIDHVNADWDAQAVDAAKGYMQMGGFSQESLIQQLTSSAGNGFTQAQAEYAASQVGL